MIAAISGRFDFESALCEELHNATMLCGSRLKMHSAQKMRLPSHNFVSLFDMVSELALGTIDEVAERDNDENIQDKTRTKSTNMRKTKRTMTRTSRT
eukprot:6365749-Amphidinium_carterae.3